MKGHDFFLYYFYFIAKSHRPTNFLNTRKLDGVFQAFPLAISVPSNDSIQKRKKIYSFGGHILTSFRRKLKQRFKHK